MQLTTAQTTHRQAQCRGIKCDSKPTARNFWRHPNLIPPTIHAARLQLPANYDHIPHPLVPRPCLGTHCDSGSAATTLQATPTTLQGTPHYNHFCIHLQHTAIGDTPSRYDSAANKAATTTNLRAATAKLALAQTTASPPHFKQNAHCPARVIYIALLRLLVATIGCIHRLRQRPPSTPVSPTRTATHRSHTYNTPSTAPSHRNHPLRPASKTKTYNYDDSAPSYDALHNLRRQTYNPRAQPSLIGLNDMSQYRAYFVPGSLDPSGAQNIEVTPTPEFGGFSGECGELWAPNYKFGLKDPSKNTGGGYFAQKVEIMCGIAECGCARNSLKSTATVYEVWPVKIKPGLDSYNSGKLQITDQNPIRARQGYSGGEGLFHRGSIYSS